ncbi:calcium-binding protein [Kordiimonas lipolytica]|uniref:Calcium-binding protein n=1 Tax=Kordiimonas lipolytica TaxID=1662421 RepID=A0ABV8U978_9PROT|nr:calcium-binding protein [Kordiimonas lipolytica]
MSVIRGTDGDDTLVGGAGDSLYGRDGADVYVIDVAGTTIDGDPVSVAEDSSDGEVYSGDDTIDLSANAASISNIVFGWEDGGLELLVYDDNGVFVGKAEIDEATDGAYTGEVEYLRLGDGVYALPAGLSAAEMNGMFNHGATSGNDTIRIGVNVGQYISALAGNDTFIIQGDGIGLYGGDGDDIYEIAWDDDLLTGEVFATTIWDGRLGGHDGQDVLDLSAFVSSLDQLVFVDDEEEDLIIRVHDEEGVLLGVVNIIDQYYDHPGKVETLVFNGGELSLSGYGDVRELNSRVMHGTSDAADTLFSRADDEAIFTYGGDDTVTITHENVEVNTGDGDDRVNASGIHANVNGGAGDDRLLGGDGGQALRGGDGNDYIRGGAGVDGMSGGDGNDSLWAGADDDSGDQMDGGAGDDIIGGGAGDDTLSGGAGSDILFGGEGNDAISAGRPSRHDNPDDDDLSPNQAWGGAGDDTLLGGADADTMGGGLGDDWLQGGDGNDILFAGKEGADVLSGDGGDDLIFAGSGDDLVRGDLGNDELYGGTGNDSVRGGQNNDTLYGGAGDDTLIGNEGDDVLRPGAGSDILRFSAGSGNDTVEGFSVSEDALALSWTVSEFTDAESVLAAATDTADGVLIDLGGGDSVLLTGLTVSDLVDADFIF